MKGQNLRIPCVLAAVFLLQIACSAAPIDNVFSKIECEVNGREWVKDYRMDGTVEEFCGGPEATEPSHPTGPALSESDCVLGAESIEMEYVDGKKDVFDGNAVCNANWRVTNLLEEDILLLAEVVWDNTADSGTYWESHPIPAGEKWDLPVNETKLASTAYVRVMRTFILRASGECAEWTAPELEDDRADQAVPVQPLACP